VDQNALFEAMIENLPEKTNVGSAPEAGWWQKLSDLFH